MNKILSPLSTVFSYMKVPISDSLLWVLYTSYKIIEIVSFIFQNLNIVAYLIVPVGWGSCLLRLAILLIYWIITISFLNLNDNFLDDISFAYMCF